MNNMMAEGSNCKYTHHKMGAVFMILFALTFILKAMGSLDAEMVNWIWPILVALFGFMKLGDGKCKCC